MAALTGLSGLSGLSGISGGDPYAAIRSGLIAQYKMNGASGAGEPDTINGYDFVNNGTIGTAAGKINTCRVFPGNGHWLSYATAAPFNLYPYTIACWLKLTASSGMWLWRYNSALNGYTGYFTGGKVSFFHYVGGGNYISGTFGTAINDDTWKHIAIVVDASGATGYLNGVSDGVLPWTGTPQAPSSGGYFAASVSNLNNVGFAGNMDCLCVWDRALTGSEVGLHYNSGNGVEL